MPAQRSPSPSSSSSSSSSSGDSDESYSSSSSVTEATHSTASSRSSSCASSGTDGSASGSGSGSASRSSSASSRSSRSSAGSTPSSSSRSLLSNDEEAEGDHPVGDFSPTDGDVPLKLPRLEEVSRGVHPARQVASAPAAVGGKRSASIFPAPPQPPSLPDAVPVPGSSRPPPPRYGPIFPAPPPPPFTAWTPPPLPPPPPPLPTLSASAKDLTEVDVRAGLRIGVYRAPTRLNKEQVMDEVESVRMTSTVERVVLETAQQLALPGVPAEEREYAWATIFLADAEAAELCAARLCQPGRRSKWPRVCIQRLPVVSHVTAPLRLVEEQQLRVHVYQLESAAASAGMASLANTPIADTVLARSAYGWCVLSTGGLFPTLGLANYLKNRRNGDFCSVDICATFKAEAETGSCSAGGQCSGLHLRDVEQWKVLVPVVLYPKTAIGTSPSLTPVQSTPPGGAGAATAGGVITTTVVAETPWQKERHADSLVVRPLPTDIDESAFLYMFRGCKGFVRAQTVRIVDKTRYGVVQFTDAASAELARQQATTSAQLPVEFYGAGTYAGGTGDVAQRSQSSTSAVADSPAPALTPFQLHPPDDSSTEGVTSPDKSSLNADAAAAAAAGGRAESEVPFPPLPEGWEYGVSRRTMQYFFVQSGKKSTTWKHPVTQEQYKAAR